MIVILSWYSDGGGEPEIRFCKLSTRNEEFYGVSKLAEDIRATEHKECRVWEVVNDKHTLLYDSAPQEKERKQ